MDISNLRIGIVGATGAVGQVALRILESYHHPIEKIEAIASPRSQGKKIKYLDNYLTVKIFYSDILDSLDAIIISISPSGLISPTIAVTFEVPMSSPTKIFLSCLRAILYFFFYFHPTEKPLG